MKMNTRYRIQIVVRGSLYHAQAFVQIIAIVEPDEYDPFNDTNLDRTEELVHSFVSREFLSATSNTALGEAREAAILWLKEAAGDVTHTFVEDCEGWDKSRLPSRNLSPAAMLCQLQSYAESCNDPQAELEVLRSAFLSAVSYMGTIAERTLWNELCNEYPANAEAISKYAEISKEGN